MSGLLWVSLEGNPISYHPNHRLLSLQHLHPSLSSSKVKILFFTIEYINYFLIHCKKCILNYLEQFVLDRVPLRRAEKILVSANRSYPSRSIGSVPRDYFSSLSDFTSEHSSTSLDASLCDDVDNKRQSLDLMDSLNTSIISMTKSRKKQTVKEAIIAEDEQVRESSPRKSVSLSSSFLGRSINSNTFSNLKTFHLLFTYCSIF